ncbi:aldose 1-epimerase family protein [Pseudoroseomonas globiformis]|uniref:Aldose 1-epimerase family protein n=1 Tax=Teichococcus globiformis TaxID=2307229 RepID=A0ABV7FXU6_9PROT
MSGERHEISGGGLSATISADGAELVRLRGPDGADLLWDGGAAWPRHAPVLFPIVGRLADDTLRHAGAEYRMTQHGFARDRRFGWVARDAGRAVLALAEDAESRARFPFPFRLEVAYAAEPAGLSVVTTVSNPGTAPLPFSLGAHPAFRWPLRPGTDKKAHRLVFEADEQGEAHYLCGGLLGPAEPAPCLAREWPLSPALFARDAVILKDVASRSVRYEGPGGPALRVRWDGYPDLGLWSKPEGADFLCIEPWQGTASPAGWDGPFAEKPGLVVLPPGGQRRFAWSAALEN